MLRIVRVIVIAVACAGLQTNRAAGQVTSLVILVHDTAGHPMAKVQIGVFNVDEDREAPPAVTDSLGRLVCSVTPGRYRFSARSNGYLPSITNHVVPVAAADTLRFVFRLRGQIPEPGMRNPHPAAAAPVPPDPKASCG